VITGFNTDIEHNGVTYHVQTEDKGLDKPMIMSLVYSGGEILASKRSPYEDLIAAGFDENTLIERLKRQHNLICAAIQQGRIDDLKRMTMREPKEQQRKTQKKNQTETTLEPEFMTAGENSDTAEKQEEPLLEIPIAVLDEAAEVKLEPEPVSVPHPARVLRSDSVETVADFARIEDLPIHALNLRFLEEREYRGGDRVEMRIQATNQKDEPLIGTEIMVKILGSAFRPLIFHAKTGENGVAVVHLQLPHFRSGRAALLIRASNDGYEAELRRIVTQS
jgi:hypothetical protein